MKSNTAYRTKLRAVFLAAIMVTSVVGMSVAFTGSAAAMSSVTYQNNLDNPYQGQEVVLESTNILQNSEYDLRIVNSYDDSDTVQSSSSIRDIFSEDDAPNRTVIDTSSLEAGDYFIVGPGLQSTSQVSADDTFEVRIQSLDAEFDDDVVTSAGGDAVTELDIDSNRGSYSLNVSVDGDLSEDELLSIFIGNDSLETVHLDSNVRDNVTFDDAGNPVINVDSSGDDFAEAFFDALGNLDDDGLENALSNAGFNQPSDIRDSGELDSGFLDVVETLNSFKAFAYSESEDDADEQIVLVDIRDTDADVSFAGIDEGDYTFEFNVGDTEASASTDITVREEDVDGAFSQGVYQQTAGDIVEFELELEDTDEVWVQIGDQDAGFVDVVYIKADDEDEPVTFEVNTRTLGADGTFSNVYNLGDNVDTLESAIHSTTTSNIGTDQFYNDNTEQSLTFEEYLEALDLIDDAGTEDGFDQLTRPMQPTDYELVAAAAGSDGTFIVNDDDESEADDELDSAVLELQAPSLGEITTWVAPADDANEDDTIEDLLESVTQRDDIALDDRLVVQYEASGIFGGMVAASDDDFDILEDGTSADLIAEYDGGLLDDEGINFLFESEDAIGNQDPTSLDFSNLDDESETFLILDNEGGQFFLIVDTDADVWDSGEPEDGDTFEIELEYETDDDDRAKFDDVGQGTGNNALSLDPAGYPYFAADSTQTISAEINFEDAAISFNNLNADGEVQAENIEDSEISGVTNIAPGSSGEIRVASTDASTSFRIGQSVEITDDGTVSATFDFSGQEVGDEFDTRFRISGSNVDTVDSVIVAEGDLGVEEPVEDDDEEPVDDDPEPVDDDDDVADDDDDDDEEPVDDETPGFGVLVALLAIIGAALLATRRQN